MVGSSGDGLAFFTVSDALAIQFDVPGEAVRLERAARRARLENIDLGRLATAAARPRRRSCRAASLRCRKPQVSAVLVTLHPGADAAAVRATLGNWPDITVYSTQEQKDLLLSGMVDKARRQLGLFRVLLIIISTIIIALIIYTLTLDKIRDIALLKLIGARNGVIGGLILQQSLLMGAFGYALAWWIGQFAFPRFPRLVVIETADLISARASSSSSSPRSPACSASGKPCAWSPTPSSPHEHARRRSHAPPQSLWQRPHRSRRHPRCLAEHRARRDRRHARPQRQRANPPSSPPWR